MAISTQTEALLDLYNQKLTLDQQQLEQINIVQNGYTIQTGIGSTEQVKIWGPEEIIENYTAPIKKLDNRILELNNQITDLKNNILSIGQSASTAGCGTTASYVSVAASTISCKVYAFSGGNPFSETTETLSSTNLGVGVTNSVVIVGLGSYSGDVGTCYTTCTGAPGGSCTAAAASITYYENQIPSLLEERDDLMIKVNFLKNARVDYELQNYAYNRSKVQINNSIGISSSIISFLENPDNEEWL